MTLTLRRDKGSPLTHDEVDDNFLHASPTSGTTQDNLDVVDPRGMHTIWVPAYAMVPLLAGGAVSAQVDTATSEVVLKTLDFEDTNQAFAQFIVQMPKSWDLGALQAKFVWSAASTGGVAWGISLRALSDGDDVDVSPVSYVIVTDSNPIAERLRVTDLSSTIYPQETPAFGDLLVVEVYRDPSDAGDTLTGDARLHGVSLYFNTNAATDD